MSDEPSDDYFEAAAKVIEAARELDAAREERAAAEEVVLNAFDKQRKAEKKLKEAIEGLKNADTGRDGQK